MNAVFCTRELTEGLTGAENIRARIEKRLPKGSLVCGLDQIHSNRVVVAEDIDNDSMPEADAIISSDISKALFIRTADCVPVLAESKTHIAAIHAGWRGIASGIIEKTVGMMKDMGASDIRISIGPAIGPCCYEIGAEVAKEIGLEFCRGAGEKYFADLWKAAQGRALEAGIDKSRITVLRLCTCCNEKLFYSFRRGDDRHRNVSIIGGEACSLPGLRAQ